MERLTERQYGEIVSSKRERTQIHCSNFCNNCSQGTGNCDYVREMVEKLAEYEDAEEQGLLLRLPCKVGDTVYLTEHDRLVFRDKPLICIVDEFSISGTDCCAILNANEPFYALHRFKAVNIKDFGKIVFLTKEEAEKKLAEMKEGAV